MLKPRKGRVILIPLENEQTASGIFIPGDVKNPENTQRAEVASLHKDDEGDILNTGDIVFFSKWYSRDVEFQGETYKETSIDEILAVLS